MNTFVLIVLLLTLSPVVYQPGTSSHLDSIWSVTEAQRKDKNKVSLEPLGFILLPEGYKAYRERVWVDVWYGYIESQDKLWRINYSAGLVQTPFQVEPDAFIWTKTENLSKSVLKYGLRRKEGKEFMAANIGLLNLTAEIKRESDKDTFLEIARSYKREECKDCGKPLPASPSNKSVNTSVIFPWLEISGVIQEKIYVG